MASAAVVALPVFYLAQQAAQSDDGTQVFSQSNIALLGSTLLLVGAVLVTVTLVALTLAWLTVRTNLVGRRAFTILAVLPLAIPGYVTAYAIKAMGGDNGILNQLFGLHVPYPKGFWFALFALASYNLPYMFLMLRAVMQDMNPAQEEAARSLGHRRIRVFFSVQLPQLKPALLAGGLLVALHVLADFGVVSLMRYDTFSRVLWQKYTSPATPHAAAVVALFLVGVAALFIVVEMFFLRKLRLDHAGMGGQRRYGLHRLGWWHPLAVAFCVVLFLAAVVLPTFSVLFWFARAPQASLWQSIRDPLLCSLQASVPAALCATAIAIPIARLRARYPSKSSFILERLPFIGYAVPALAFALSLIKFFSASWTPDWLFAFYQSLPLLVFALSIHFLAEAVGPVRSSMYLVGPRMEEASRSLGRGRWTTFWRVTMPVLGNGLAVSAVLVFLSCMKELPLTMLLSPPGFETLAHDVWDASENASFANAAPPALAILVFSAGFVGIVLLQGKGKSQ